jgi:phage FluMu protein Com
MIELKKCPDCGGTKLLPDGKTICNCTRGMIVICGDCNVIAIDKGHIPSNQTSELGISEYTLYQCPRCKDVERINIYSKNWYDI